MKSDKGQSFILVGIGLLLLAGICVYISLSQPKIAVVSDASASQTAAGATANQQATGATAYFEMSTVKSGGTAPRQSTTAAAETVSYPLNLNKATAEELMTIDGIGASRAASILSYRDYLGGYKSVEQLKDISGIGDGVYAKIAPYLTV